MKLNEVIAKYGNQEVDETEIKELLGVKESKVWKPKRNEHYYFFDYGGTFRDRFISNVDENRYELGNCYKTYTEAEFAREKQIFLTKFEHYLRENEDEHVDWGNDVEKFYITFDYSVEEIDLDWVRGLKNQGTLYTTNKNALKLFIEKNETDIKKYMFGVE